MTRAQRDARRPTGAGAERGARELAGRIGDTVVFCPIDAVDHFRIPDPQAVA